MACAAVAADEQRAFAAFWKRWVRADAEPTRDGLIAWAVEAGLDARRFAHALGAADTLERVGRDVAIARAMSLGPAPVWLLNGQRLPGDQSAQALEVQIRAELEATQALLAGGARHSELVVARVSAHPGPLAAAWRTYIYEAAPVPADGRPSTGHPTAGQSSATAALQPAAVMALPGPPRAVILSNAPTPTSDVIWQVTVRPDDPQIGNPNAKVTVVVFRDWLAEEGAALWPALVERARTRPDAVRVVLKHLPRPVHPASRALSESIESARELGNWLSYAEALRAGITRMAPGTPPEVRGLIDTARDAVRLNRGAFANSIQSHSGKPRVDADLDQAAALGVDGFSAVFVNGVRLGDLDAATLDRLIAAQSARADAALAKGASPAGLYAALVADGQLLDSLAAGTVPLVVPRGDFDGLPGAPVEVVVFGDFQCPYTARLWPHLQSLAQELPGRFRVAWLDFPQPDRHPLAQRLAEAGHEARAQGHFWAFRTAVAQEVDSLAPASLLRAAKLAGMNTSKLKRALDRHIWAPAVAADKRQGLAADVRATPAVYLDGHLFQPPGGISATTLRPAILRLLATH